MGLTEVFKHKKTGRKVIYKDICTFESIEESESTEFGIKFLDKKIDIQTCILCEDFDTHVMYTIPIIQFMNYYEPAASMIDQMMDTVEKLMCYTARPKNAENEGNKENIHTLHSEQSETDAPTATPGV